MGDGDIRLYDTEKNLLHTLKTGDPIAAVRFGPYAREDGALAVVSTSGSVDGIMSLEICLLKRRRWDGDISA